MLTEIKINELRLFAMQIRLETLQAFKHLGFGHVGGAMSIVETLAVLYGAIMNINPNEPNWPDRDWLVLSKGHAGPSLYATLALKNYFPLEDLKTLNTPGTNLPSHCDRNKTVGVDMTTGSLGHGISTAIGVALGNQMDGRSSFVYLIMGDGECNEGQVWEGAMFAAHHQVDNLVAFIDYNKQQLDGFTCDIMDMGDLSQKFASFGWHVQDIDGHDTVAIYEAIKMAKAHKGQPSVIILNTSKGKGCCFAEGVLDNHHMTFSEEALNEAIDCVKNSLCSFEGSVTKQRGVVK
jgi:transketolase